jgi:hypothetical protein
VLQKSICRDLIEEVNLTTYKLFETTRGAVEVLRRRRFLSVLASSFLSEALWTYRRWGLSSAVLVGHFSFRDRDRLYELTGAVCLKISTE